MMEGFSSVGKIPSLSVLGSGGLKTGNLAQIWRKGCVPYHSDNTVSAITYPELPAKDGDFAFNLFLS